MGNILKYFCTLSGQGILKHEQCLGLKSNVITMCYLGSKAGILRQYLIWVIKLFMVLEPRF